MCDSSATESLSLVLRLTKQQAASVVLLCHVIYVLIDAGNSKSLYLNAKSTHEVIINYEDNIFLSVLSIPSSDRNPQPELGSSLSFSQFTSIQCALLAGNIGVHIAKKHATHKYIVGAIII